MNVRLSTDAPRFGKAVILGFGDVFLEPSTKIIDMSFDPRKITQKDGL